MNQLVDPSRENASVAAPVPVFVDAAACARALAFIGDIAAQQAPAGAPGQVRAPAIAAFAGSLAALGRDAGSGAALRLLATRHDPSHPAWLASGLRRKAATWVAELDQAAARGQGSGAVMPLTLLADLIDMQQPWLCGHSRRVAAVAQMAARRIGLDEPAQARCHRAGLLQGLGRGAVADALWNASAPLSPSSREQLRLASYWTLRALREVGAMAVEAEIASFVGERLDGSGDFRAAVGAAIPIEGQVLAAAAAWVALQAARPWRPAYSAERAGTLLAQEAQAGRFHPFVVEVLCGAPDAAPRTVGAGAARTTLSEREAAVLRAISKGHTNKEIARLLAISPRTVGTHVESAFRKLRCTTRAAAALKALTLRLI